MPVFDVNMDSVVKLTNRLGKLHKSALPIAIRGTLNSAAFETKKWIPKTAARKFVTRKKSFFRAFSSVEKASGFDINSMESRVGILANKKSKVAEGLEKQETGGVIKGRKLVPHDKGRVSGSRSKQVRKSNRFRSLGKIHTISGHGKRDFSRGVRGTMKAGKSLLLIKKGGKGTVFKITGIKSSIKSKKLIFKAVPVYSYRNTKVSRVKKSPFMRMATKIAVKRMPKEYFKQAEKQIQRLR